MLLTSSIRKSKIVKGSGVPSGIKWDKNPLKFLTREKITNLNQIPRETQKTEEIWEDKGKLKEKTEKKLTKMIRIKVEKNSRTLALLNIWGLRDRKNNVKDFTNPSKINERDPTLKKELNSKTILMKIKEDRR